MITKEQAQAWKSPKSSHGVHINSGTLNEFCDAVIALHERVERLTGALKLCRPWLEGPASGDCSHPEHAAADLAEIDATLTEGAAP